MRLFIRRSTPAGLLTFRLEVSTSCTTDSLRCQIAKRLSLSPHFSLYAVLSKVKVTTTQTLMPDGCPASRFLHGEEAVLFVEDRKVRKRECHPALQHLQQATVEGDKARLVGLYQEFEQRDGSSLEDWDIGLLDQDCGLGWTCLHLACEQGHASVVEWLLEQDCDVNAETVEGWTPLALAAAHNHCDCTLYTGIRALGCSRKLLMGYFSEVKGTALDCARRAGHVEAREVLLSLHNALDSRTLLARARSLADLSQDVEADSPDTKLEGVEVPPPFTGLLSYSESRTDRTVFLVLLPHLGRLQRYATKEAFYDQSDPEGELPLEAILEVKLNKSSGRSFLVVCHKSGRERYFSEFPEVTAEWQRQVHYSMTLHRSKRESFLRAYPLRRNPSHETLADSSTDTSMEKEAEVTLQDFEVLDVVGAGAFGRVYKVQKRDSGQIFALKALDKRTLTQKNQLKHALNEGKIHARLNSPFIIKLHYKFQTPRKLYFVLDFCPNGDLGDLLTEHRSISEDKVKIYMGEALLALEHLHDRDVLYRDMKPDNLLLDAEGHVKLADFGLATETGDELNTTFCGTLAYLSPEMLRRQGASKASDVYGWGAVVYELLTGDAPHYSADMPTMLRKIKTGKLSLPWRLSANAKSLLTATMAVDPTTRPDVAALKRHAFFNGMDWSELERRASTAVNVKSRTASVSAGSPVSLRDMDYSEKPSMEECLLEF